MNANFFHCKHILSASICLLLCVSASAQTASPLAKPKLVVGIVVDQMSYEFLYRYQDEYSDGGFKRLLKEGYSCENTHYNYIPTYTGPGHACIYTGSIPAINGIISNDWYDENTHSIVYVVDDSSVHAVGAESMVNKMSPRNLLTTTITDMLKLSDQQQSKVVGVALKDRGAILPAGHSANAAYWYDGYVNAWLTSSYYMDTLPKWVQGINAAKPYEQYMNRNWNLFLPASAYKNSTGDSMMWETKFIGEAAPTFPHYLNFNGVSESIKSTPFGNTMTEQFAEAAIKNEELGKDAVTDFLCVSFSSTDYVGHAYGPHSMETEDTYLRLDRDLATFINYLDTNIGKGNYLLFLTADHGVSPVPQYLQSLKIPSGTTTAPQMVYAMHSILMKNDMDTSVIAAYENQQIYLNDSVLTVHHLTKENIYQVLYDPLMHMDGVNSVTMINALNAATMSPDVKDLIINGIYTRRSGDIQIMYDPYWFEAYRPTGTTHGSPFSYDTHVPLIFYGWKVKPGELHRNIHVVDIAPTIASMLKISEPNGCVGEVIGELFK